MKKTVNAADIAVALNYDGHGAPLVTAKGKGANAEQILQLAQDHNVPIHADPELVKLLASIPLEHEIPPELYRAVAEVIAFAFLLSGKTPPQD